MAHRDQSIFVEACIHYFGGGSVLEVGSYDVNGTIRGLFNGLASEYWGVDLTEGPGVDLVCSGHLIDFGRKFDTVVSCECLEHNPFWEETLQKMALHTNRCMIVTCAAPGRIEHGTSRTKQDDSPGTSEIGWDYYHNISKSEFIEALEPDKSFQSWMVFENRRAFDLYFVGMTHENFCAEALRAEIEKRLGDSRPRQSMLKIFSEIPLTIARYLLSDESFQNFAVPYDKIRTKLRGNYYGG